MKVLTMLMTALLVALDRRLALAAARESEALFNLTFPQVGEAPQDVRGDPRWKRHAARMARIERAIDGVGRLVACLPSWALAPGERALFRRKCQGCHRLVALGEECDYCIEW